jgi:hypothetical protein
MSVTTAPPHQRPAGNGGPDELDRKLTAFFRRELPSPWPPPPTPSPSQNPTPARRPARALSRSRLVLAASIVALIAGSWFLSGKLPNLSDPGGDPMTDGTATVPMDLRHQPQARPR